jgi:hypothetical protein
MNSFFPLNLLKNAKHLKIFILGTSSLVGICILFFSFVYVKAFEKNYANPLALTTEGKIIPSKLVPLEKLFVKEATEHLLTFTHYFFSYDQYNYAARIQKALSLGDDSIKIAYQRLKEKDLWYNLVVENSIVQKIKAQEASFFISIKEKGPHGWPFQIQAPLEITSSDKNQTFLLAVKGILKKTKRVNGSNPHGLLITAFTFEKKKLP